MAKLISKTYGDALFELAQEENALDKCLKETQTVQEIFRENPDLLQLLEHPKVIREEKIQVMENVFKGRISDDVLGLLVLTITKGRSKNLQEIFAYFAARVKEHKKIGLASVVSAVSLSEDWKAKIEQKLLDTTGYTTMEMKYQVDERLIGGLRIRIGDRVIDSSLSGKLEELRGQLMKVSLEA